jgi:hypothetical protein
MGKVYLRYAQQVSFGIINSPNSNALLADPFGRFAISAALENVNVWNIRQNVLVRIACFSSP